MRKRLETTPKTNHSDAGMKKKKSKEKNEDKSETAPEPQPNLMCLEVDICEPLSRMEWDHYLTVINETKGMGWFQVLPVGQKSSMPYQFNMLHILPQAKIPVERLPIDAFVNAKLSLLRKQERENGSATGLISGVPAQRT